MKIKDVEKAVGITSANIRFYEKEGLIAPRRNNDNNYREYTKEDVERLQQIKILRVLGVSVQDLRLLFQGEYELDEIIQKRQEEMEKEAEHLHELQEVCNTILRTGVDLDHLNFSILDEKSAGIRDRLEQVLYEDAAEVEITKQEYYRYIWKWLAAALLLDAVLCYLFSGVMEKILLMGSAEVHLGPSMTYLARDFWIVPVLILLAVFTALSTIWTAKMWALYMNFILAALELPLFVFTLKWIVDKDLSDIRFKSAGLFAAAALFVVIFGLCLDRFEKMDRNCGYGALGALVYSGGIGLLYYFNVKDWVYWSVLLLAFLMYISVTTVMGSRDRISYTKFAGIVTAINTVNFVAVMIAAYGNTKSWRRDGKVFR